VSRIFLSHSSADNAAAVALRDWLVAEGWNELFLDLDPQRGLKAGERWQAALKAAAERCQLVVVLISPAWAASKWCLAEFLLAKSLNKRILGVLVEPTPLADLPTELTAEWQLTDLTAGARDYQVTVTLPPPQEKATVAFATHGLDRVRTSLRQAGLDARFFAWPPDDDPSRSPYRGLRPLEAEDAGIFFGREAPIVKALDQLRGLRETNAPRLLVILGASGAGKSSFLRAGLLPRLKRQDRAFLVLPIVRPQQAALYGETGLLRALETACEAAKIAIARADLRAAIAGGAPTLRPILTALVERAAGTFVDPSAHVKPPMLVISVDQAEELFLAEGEAEAKPLLGLLRDLVTTDAPAVIVAGTIRSDNYEALQVAPQFEGLRQEPFSLPPMPQGSYAEVIKGPAVRLEGTARALTIDDALVDALLGDIEAGGAKDALPLLSFTLERLYDEYHAGGRLKLEHYTMLGGVKGSIEAAVERAMKAADADPSVPKDAQARLELLRRALIPWLAGIDPDTGAPRRRVARLSEIPQESRPLVDHLVEQRLLATDLAAGTGETTIEPAHEALLRQWSLLQGWLTEDAGLLSVMDAVARAAKDWDDRARSAIWLTHTTGRLDAAEQVLRRPDLAASLGQRDRDYLAGCHEAQRLAREKELAAGRNRQRLRIFVGVLLCGIIAGLVGWINQATIKEQWNWYAIMRPYMNAHVRPFVLSAAAERALRPTSSFQECEKNCPEMVALPPGGFVMGSPEDEKGHTSDESPLHAVTVSPAFAISRYLVTFADWDACVAVGGCPPLSDSGFGRGNKPVVNVNWNEAQQYVAWLSLMTGKSYRLLSEAEWEYAERAGTRSAYFWGDDIGVGNAVCIGCGSKWDNKQTAPVGSFNPNAFGLYDMLGNAWVWVEDCYHDSYAGSPADGSAWTQDCEQGRRAVRSGGWDSYAINLRSANRDRISIGTRINDLGFRIARTLEPGSLLNSANAGTLPEDLATHR
jgi:formylglycine-generating enzyme required for sulfatase activity